MKDDSTRPASRLPLRQWIRTLIAIFIGNLLYFSLQRFLPPAGRHRPFHLDLGVLIDLWVCIVLYVLLGYLPWFRRSATPTRPPL
jgi:hypothetical protein